jgi:hypothetical protein
MHELRSWERLKAEGGRRKVNGSWKAIREWLKANGWRRKEIHGLRRKAYGKRDIEIKDDMRTAKG